ncbi:MAG: hypothetical protein N3D11_16695 [Candidatus Sumerlaeia bacterium]|nr:hypothetical protein [Candidatus Sumerlaeia bacterium]
MLGKVLLTGFGLITYGLTRFAFNVLVLRILSPAFLGEVNQTLSVFLIFPTFYAPALGNVVSRFASEFIGAGQAQKARQIFSLSLVLVAAASVVGTAVAWLVFPALQGNLPIARTTVFVLAPMLALNSFYGFLKASYYGYDRVSKCLANEIVASSVFFVVLAAALVLRSRFLALLPFLAHALVFSATAVWHLRDQLTFRALFRDIAPDLRRCAHFLFCTIINSLTGPGAFHLGIVLTGRLTGNSEIAAYYAVLLYSLQPLNLVPVSLVTVMMPTISRHYGAGQLDAGVEISERSFRPLFLLMTLICGGCAILGQEALLVIVGSQRTDLLAPFLIILIAMYGSLISSAPGILLNATRHIGQIASSGAVGALAAIVLWNLAIPRWGLLGSALGYAALQLTKGAWAFLAARRLLRWRARMGWSPWAGGAAAAGLAAVSLLLQPLWYHMAIALLFTVLIVLFHVRDLVEYFNHFTAAVRGGVSPSQGDSLNPD